MKILNQVWLSNARRQLEQHDVPTLVSLLYQTVQPIIEEGVGKFSVGQTEFHDGRLMWDVVVSNKRVYQAAWSYALKDSLIDIILRHRIAEWDKSELV